MNHFTKTLAIIALTMVATTVPNSLAILCPVFEAVTDLDLESFMTNHTAHGWLTLQGSEPNLGCLSVEFQGDEFTMEPVTVYGNLQYIDLDDETPYSIAYEAIVPDLSQPGVWQVVQDENTAYTFYILYADEDYTLTAQCADEDGESRVFLNVRGARDHMPTNIVHKFLGILENQYGLDVTNYHPVNHDHHLC